MTLTRSAKPVTIHRDALNAAIVDLDGTLVDTLHDIVTALNAMLLDHALPTVDRTFAAKVIGRGSEHLVRQTLEHVGAEAALYEAARAGYQAHYRRVNGRLSMVYPGVFEGLDSLRALGWALACVTNKPRAFAIELLRVKGLQPYFSVVYGGDDFERRKPDPLPLLKACEAMGSIPAHTLMIGDSSTDARAARAAGCPVVLVTYGYNHAQPIHEVDADAFVDRLDRIFLD